MAGPLVRFVLTTVGVGALVLCLAWALRRRGVMGAGQGELRVTERQATGKDQSLLVVEAGGRRLLVGQTPGGMATLAELGPCTPDGEDQRDGTDEDQRDGTDVTAPAAPARSGRHRDATVPPTSIIAWVRELRARRRDGSADGVQAADEVPMPGLPEARDAATDHGHDGVDHDGVDHGGVDVAPEPGAATFSAVLAAAAQDPDDGADGAEEAVEVSGSEATPVVSGAEDTPAVRVDEVAPSVSGSEATPMVSGSEATPMVSGAEVTPVVSGAEVTPVTLAVEDEADGRVVGTPTMAPTQPARTPSVQSLDDEALTRVLMELDARTVLTAIKGAPTSFAERVGTCFAAGDDTRRQALVNCAMNMRDVVLSPQEVRAARREVAQAARRLIEWGEISPGPAAGSAEAFSKVYARVGGGRA